MRAPDVLRLLWTRHRHPLPWIAVATFGGMATVLNASLRLEPAANGAGGPMTVLASTFMGALGLGFLSPLPWQWTGDDRPECGLPRGAFQSLVFGGAFFALARTLDGLLAQVLGSPSHHSPFWRLPLDALLLQLASMALVGFFIARAERRDGERLEAQSELARAKDAMLRSQLSPHSLFNTLNALAELALRDPEATERALLDLSDLYEQMLRMSALEQITLGEERAFLERYLALQSMRLGDRLHLEWTWDPALDGLRVPPLLLQPLAENAIKHGIACEAEGGALHLRAWRERGFLGIEVRNTGRPPGTRRPGGTGLANLEGRLRLAYGGRATFSLERDGAWTRATLLLPEAP